MPTLVSPDSKYQKSYLEAVKEYQAEKLPHYLQFHLEDLNQQFERYVQTLLNQARGLELPPGYVPHSEFWLVEGNEYLGRLDIRHELSPELRATGGHIGYDIRPSQRGHGFGTLILKLGVEKAKKLGLKKILITCDVTNVSSNKVIRTNGGVLENTVPVGQGKPDKNRYWIT